MTTLVNEQLKAIEEKQLAIDKEKKALRDQTIREIQTLIETFDISSSELKFFDRNVTRRRTTVGVKVPMKYCGPRGELWSGRGRAPHWVQEVENNGGSRDDYLIKH